MSTLSGDGWSLLIYVAALAQAIGFMYRDQITLRVALFVGTILYILYYLLEPEIPLWDAVFIAGVIGLVNLWVLVSLINDKFSKIRGAELQIYHFFESYFNTGMFRRVISAGEVKKSDEAIELTTEGQALDKLYFIVDKKVQLNKRGVDFDYKTGSFIGEVAYLTGTTASATVSIPVETTYIVWEHKALKDITERYPDLNISLKAMLGQDMAHKVRLS